MATRIFRLLYNKFYPPPLPPPNTFNGYTVLITGATSGLGLEAAIHYVSIGASQVIITARTLSRGATAKAAIESRTGSTGVVQVRELNMDTFAGVKTFVDALKAEVKTIDVVLLNAGVIKVAYEQTPDGWEETLQVNALSTALLGLLLLPWMKTSPSVSGRTQHLGFVSSGLHAVVDIQTEDFPKKDVLRCSSDEKRFSPGRGNYAVSKLFMMYAVAEMVKLAVGKDGSPSPIINTCCPGVCKSDLGREYEAKGVLYSVGVSIFYNTLAKSTAAGANTLVLSTVTGPEEHGKFIKHYGSDEEYGRQAARALTNEAGKKMQAEVWKEMLQVFEAAIPGVSKIAQPEMAQSKL